MKNKRNRFGKGIIISLIASIFGTASFGWGMYCCIFRISLLKGLLFCLLSVVIMGISVPIRKKLEETN